MEAPEYVRGFWAEFQALSGRDLSERFYEAFHFDDNEKDANALAALVLSGAKRGTASLLWTYEASQKALPAAGCFSVVTTWDRRPVCVIETVKVDVAAYDEVTEVFAALEGEGDGTLSYWRRVHWRYFGRECARLGRAPGLEMPVVCEEFSVVYGGEL